MRARRNFASGGKKDGEYLVNIGLGRGTAQKRVTGGRWRRIVLGDVLAGHRRGVVRGSQGRSK